MANSKPFEQQSPTERANTLAELREREIEVRRSEDAARPFFHIRCGKRFATVDEALSHEVCAPYLDGDERALVDGFIHANELDRTRERAIVRSNLVDIGRRLTAMRVALDDAFERLNAAAATLDESERRQRDSDDAFKQRRDAVRSNESDTNT